MANLPERRDPGEILGPSGDIPDRLVDTYLLRFDRPATRRAYRNDLSAFFGSDDVDLETAARVTFVDINRYIATLEAADHKASTIKRRLAAIRGFYDWLHALGAIDRNPAHQKLVRRVKAVSSKDRPIVVLTAEQAAQLLDAADAAGRAALRNRTLMTVMLHCVLRRSEAAAMDVEHVRPIGRHWVLDIPTAKGGADQYVKIPEHVVDVIDRHRDHYGIDSGPLWRSHSRRNLGERLTANSIYRIVRKMAEIADLPEIGAHTLRHTGCTLAIESGASIQQVQSHARHKNIETTMVYVHQRDRLRDSAADFINLGNSERGTDEE